MDSACNKQARLAEIRIAWAWSNHSSLELLDLNLCDSRRDEGSVLSSRLSASENCPKIRSNEWQPNSIAVPGEPLRMSNASISNAKQRG